MKRARRQFRLGLRGRLGLTIFVLVGAAASLLTQYFVRMHTVALREVATQRSKAVRQSLEDRAEALARNGAISSAPAAVMMDFTLLQRAVSATVQADSDIAYGLITDGQNKIVVHSDKKKVGQTAAAADAKGGKGDQPVVRELKVDGKGVVEVSAPIKVGDERWGTVRYGLSLLSVDQQLAATEKHLRAVRAKTTRYSLFATLVVMFIALVVTTITTNRMTRTVRVLEEGMRAVLAGRRETRVKITKPVEIKQLAEGFGAMLETIEERDKALLADEVRADVAVEQAKRTDKTKENLVSRFTQDMLQPIDQIAKLSEAMQKAFTATNALVCPKCQESYEAPPPGQPVGNCPTCKVALAPSEVVVLTDDPGAQRGRLQEVTGVATNLLALINGVLDLAKVDAQSKQLEGSAPVKLADLAVGAKKYVDGVCDDAERVFWPMLTQPLSVEGDAARLQQAFGMVAELVVRLTARGRGTVRVEVDTCAFRGAPGVQIVFREEGPGLTPEVLESIDGGRTPDIRATMAVLLVRQVTELHHGEFSLQSEVGRGMSARLVLPQRQQTTGAARAASAPA
ncbi:MAG: HAMP domain-containing protein [Deltaproteobacteria bacterium]|nr:HAMP domain-containing protein [Deltaproteobacteria bacterium]